MVPFDPGSTTDLELLKLQRRRVRRAWALGRRPDLVAGNGPTTTGAVVGVVVVLLACTLVGATAAVREGLRRDDASSAAGATVAAAAVESPAVATSVPSEAAPTNVVVPERGATPPTTVLERATGALVTTEPAAPATTVATIDDRPTQASTTTVPPVNIRAPRPTVSPLNGAVTVEWTALSVPQGTSLAAVRVAIARADGQGEAIVQQVPARRTGTTLAGATNGLQYVATIAGVAADGRTGSASEPSDLVTPVSSRPTPPAAPTALNVAGYNGTVFVNWSFPAAPAGSLPVQKYIATLEPGGQLVEMVWAVNGLSFANAAAGVDHVVTVVAMSDGAYSQPVTSAPAKATDAGPSKPPAPSAPEVTVRSDGTWTATWLQPDSFGGGREAYYSVAPYPNTGAATSAFVGPIPANPRSQVTASGKGLQRGITYNFVVVVNGSPLVSDPSARSAGVRVPG